MENPQLIEAFSQENPWISTTKINLLEGKVTETYCHLCCFPPDDGFTASQIRASLGFLQNSNIKHGYGRH